MKPGKNTVLVILMGSSILLLLVFQLFWLKNSYEKAYFDLRRDTNFLFRSSLYSIRDSLITRNIEPLSEQQWKDSLIFKSPNILQGTHEDSMRFAMKASTVQVFVNTTSSHDSIKNILQPLAQAIQERAQGGRSFMIRLMPDTISMDTLKIAFQNALRKAGRPLAFVLKHEATSGDRAFSFRSRVDFQGQQSVENNHSIKIYCDTIKLDGVRLNPTSRYQASVLNVKSVLLKEITPQILFSFFLTSITLLSFFVLYKNLRSQQRLMEQKNDFISNVTHELKTPVATVSVALEALKNFHGLDNPERTQEYLEIAKNEMNRLTLMTDKILKASVFENKGVEIQKSPVDIKKLVEQIVVSMKLLFEKQLASVSLNVEGENFVINGSATHLTNVIYNLIDNALKYSPQPAHIIISIKENINQLTLSVQDKGIGIQKEYKKKIFEKFFRVPTGDVHNIKGYGLGLNYVASIIHQHEGSVLVESEIGKGSTFSFRLPKQT